MQIYQASTLAILLHLCILTLAAPPIVSNTPSLSVPEDASHPPLNLTHPLFHDPLPPSPYIYTVPQSHLRIKFQSFGPLVPSSDVLHCLLLAANNVNLHFAFPHAPLAVTPLKFYSGSVRLMLYPAQGNAAITWAKWGAAIRGITEFVTRFEFVDLDYYVLDYEFGGRMVAAGLISNQL